MKIINETSALVCKRCHAVNQLKKQPCVTGVHCITQEVEKQTEFSRAICILTTAE